MLRVWSARSPKRFDMKSFNRGQYVQAMEERELAEVISKVLYPERQLTAQGKELRLKQQYFFSSASVQYAVNDFLKRLWPAVGASSRTRSPSISTTRIRQWPFRS